MLLPHELRGFVFGFMASVVVNGWMATTVSCGVTVLCFVAGKVAINRQKQLPKAKVIK